MPLQRGSSRKTVVANIRELMHSFQRSGRIGASKPASNKKANKQAVAIALRQQRDSLAAGR
jgi:hypothetical protein